MLLGIATGMVTSHGLPDLPHRPVYDPMYQYYMPHQAMPLRYQQEYTRQGQTYLPPYHADKKNNDNKQEYVRSDIHSEYTSHADLHHAVTLNAHPHHADNLHENLHHAYIHRADLHHGDIHDANIHITDVHHADVHHADMQNTDVHHKDLHQAKAQVGKYCQNQLRIFVSAVQFWLLCC